MSAVYSPDLRARIVNLAPLGVRYGRGADMADLADLGRKLGTAPAGLEATLNGSTAYIVLWATFSTTGAGAPAERQPPGTFSNAQWATLQQTFPQGVCDFSKPAVAQQPTIPWLTYQNARGRVIYGGRPLGRPPVSTEILRRPRRR